MELIIPFLLGAAGGNIGGMLIKKLSLGILGNSVAGIIGGGIGGQIAQAALGGANSGLLSSVAGGTIGGILVMSLVGIIKRSVTQST